MRRVGYSIILSVVMILGTISYANSTMGDLVITAWPLNYSIEDDEFPIIVGNVKDQGSNPIEGAVVKVTFATETLSSTTNNVGSFYIESKTPASPGEYTINVIATKEGYGMDIVGTSYFVKGNPNIPELDFSIVNQFPFLIEEGLTKNPLSQIIFDHMEAMKKQQEAEQKKQQEIKKRENFLNEQRELAQNSLEEDLKSFEKTFDFNTPRKAFSRFVESVDETVQVIFWGQFNLTEKKHNEAYAAKLNALENGEDNIEATKIFQRKAAITKSEIIEHNKELNIKYGLADKTSQGYFNDQGKLRWDESSVANKTIFWYLDSKE
jgi:hypothetical protein